MWPEPPVIQSLRGFTYSNSRRQGKQFCTRRRRVAVAAVKIIADFFLKANVAAPAGVCSDTAVTARLDRMPRWLALLAELDPRDAIFTLARSGHMVPDSVYIAIETEYNSGKSCSAGRVPGLAELVLEPGTLASRIAMLKTSCCVDTPGVPQVQPLIGPAVPLGYFYYIGAGVGCGIREAREV
jgi:hypothetical protein